VSTISFKASFSVRWLTTRKHYAGLAGPSNNSRSDSSRYVHYTDTVFTPLMLVARPAVHARRISALDLPPPRRLPRRPTPAYAYYKGIRAMSIALVLLFLCSFALPCIRPNARPRYRTVMDVFQVPSLSSVICAPPGVPLLGICRRRHHGHLSPPSPAKRSGNIRYS
jgi:hypothetical protein